MANRKRDDSGHVADSACQDKVTPGQLATCHVTPGCQESLPGCCCDCSVISISISMIRVDNDLFLATLHMLLLTKDYYKSHKEDL